MEEYWSYITAKPGTLHAREEENYIYRYCNLKTMRAMEVHNYYIHTPRSHRPTTPEASTGSLSRTCSMSMTSSQAWLNRSFSRNNRQRVSVVDVIPVVQENEPFSFNRNATASPSTPMRRQSTVPQTALLSSPKARRPARPLSPPPPVFWNGKPSVPYTHAYRCFQEGNGLMFRLVDQATGTWSFYNDTLYYTITARIELGKRSKFAALDGASLSFNSVTNLYEGSVTVPPRTTQRLLQGRVKGYDVYYTADGGPA